MCWICLNLRHSYIYCPDEARHFIIVINAEIVALLPSSVNFSMWETANATRWPLGTLAPSHKPRD